MCRHRRGRRPDALRDPEHPDLARVVEGVLDHAVQHHVARAIDVVVHVARDTDGARRVVEIAEVVADVLRDTNSPALGTRRLADASAITGVLQRGRR